MSATTSLLNTTDICSLPGIAGPCRELLSRYYYDGTHCKYFTYSGCGGNENNFQSFTLCQETCIGSIPSASADTFSGYHVAGFIMIFLVLFLFCASYLLYIKRNENKFEPHQYHTYNPYTKDTKSADKYNKKECLFVSNIARNVKQSDIKQLFMDYGETINFEWKQNDVGDKKCHICFVEFKSIDDAQRAMGELNGIDIEGDKLCIRSASEYKQQKTEKTVSDKKTETLQTNEIVKKEKTENKNIDDAENKNNDNKVTEFEMVDGEEEESLLEIGHFRDISNIVKRETETIDTMNIDFDADLIIANKQHFVKETVVDTPATATVTEWTVDRSSGDSNDDDIDDDYDWNNNKIINRKKDEHSYVAISMDTKDELSESDKSSQNTQESKEEIVEKKLSHKERMRLWRQSVTQSEKASKQKIFEIKSPRQLEIVSMSNKKVKAISSDIESGAISDADSTGGVTLVKAPSKKLKQKDSEDEESSDDVLNIEVAETETVEVEKKEKEDGDEEKKEDDDGEKKEDPDPHMLELEKVRSMEIALDVISDDKTEKNEVRNNTDLESEKKRRVEKKSKGKKRMRRQKSAKKGNHRRRTSGSRSQSSLSRHRSLIESSMYFAV